MYIGLEKSIKRWDQLCGHVLFCLSLSPLSGVNMGRAWNYAVCGPTSPYLSRGKLGLSEYFVPETQYYCRRLVLQEFHGPSRVNKSPLNKHHDSTTCPQQTIQSVPNRPTPSQLQRIPTNHRTYHPTTHLA